ncbi:DUF4258 domain-containing protein [Candidatus Woesebacteria bacterium]|nr:DUF4258 domain-containing protein [Candidatus Woesebacteria bacterium]
MSISKSQIIFTKHALDRSEQRYVTQEKIEQVLQNPDKTIQIGGGKSKFIRIIDQRHFQVVASYLAKEDKWLIISAWVRGEEDSKPFIDQLIEGFVNGFVWIVKQLFRPFSK